MAGGNGSAVATSDLPMVWPHPDGDPRERFPKLTEAGFFNARKLRRWALDRKCLCGCGRETKMLRGRAGKGHSYFTNKCWPKLARKYNLRPAPSAPVRRDPAWVAGVRRENEDRYCTVDDTKWYVGMIVADCHDRGISVTEWCREKNLSRETVYQWIRAMRYNTRITKYNAGVILKALGERLPPDIQLRYDSHQRWSKHRKRTRSRTLAKAS